MLSRDINPFRMNDLRCMLKVKHEEHCELEETDKRAHGRDFYGF